MILPTVSFCSADALDACGSIFPGDAVDQYLSNLAMSAMLDYVGGHDDSGGAYFGTATLIELDDEDRTVLSILGAAAYGRTAPEVDSWHDVGAVILWGSDYKWWGDSTTYTTLAEAQAEYERFESAYSEWCDEDDEIDDEVRDAANNYLPGGLLDEIRQAEAQLGDDE